MKPTRSDSPSPLSVKVDVREISAAKSRALRDRQIAAVGRLLRRAALISKHGVSSPEKDRRPRFRGAKGGGDRYVRELY
jgi:hypothetical protein